MAANKIIGAIVKGAGNTMQYFGEQAQSGGQKKVTPEEVQKGASEFAGMFASDDRIKEKDGEAPDLVAEVAEKIRNYLYHYKPGTGEDPSIEYSGPMAQDILKVEGYRSAVFQDERGMLQVDTGRLALVNAGMIADLSQRVVLLEELLKSAFEALEQIETIGEQSLEAPPDADVA